MTEMACYGVDGSPCLNDYGYAKEVRKYDDRGNMTEVAYYGVDGSPCLNDYGYAKEVKEFNERNNIVEKQYYDIEGNQIVMVDVLDVKEGGKAYQFGLRDSYYLLEFCNWNIEEKTNISVEYMNEVGYGYRDLLLLNEDGIVEYADSGLLGIRVHTMPCSINDKESIIKLYKEWKTENRKE